MGQLNELQIKAAQPRNTEYLLADGEGLYLRVRPTAKVWVYRYKREGKEAKLSLGHYPALSLAAARKKSRAEAEKLAGGVDPRLARREDQERERVARLNTFELTARAWHAQAWKDRQWSAGYAEKVMRHLELHVFPWIGALTMETIAPTELVRCLHRIKDRGHLETAQRVREAVLHVYQYAVDVGTLPPAQNFVNSRTGGLPAPRARHYAAITDPAKLGQLLRDIEAYQGNVITRAALRLSPMLFQRPGQLPYSGRDACANPSKWIADGVVRLIAKPPVVSHRDDCIQVLRKRMSRDLLQQGSLDVLAVAFPQGKNFGSQGCWVSRRDGRDCSSLSFGETMAQSRLHDRPIPGLESYFYCYLSEHCS